MQLVYWNMYERQLPHTFVSSIDQSGQVIKKHKPPQLFRVVGHQHTMSCLQWLYQMAHEHRDHTFMIFHNDVNMFLDSWFPYNVLPVLQVDSRMAYSKNIDAYINMCHDRDVETPTLSLFCNHTIDVSKNIKWLLLSGNQLKNVRNNIKSNYDRHQFKRPLFVEKYQYSKRLPEEINVRQIPESIAFNAQPLCDTLCPEIFNGTGNYATAI